MTRLHLDQRHLWHRAARARRATVAAVILWRSRRLGAPRRRGTALGLGLLRNLLRLWRDRTLKKFEAEFVRAGLVLDQSHLHMTAGLELAEQDLVSERLLDGFLDQARHRARAHLFIVTMLSEPLGGILGQLDGHFAVAKLRLELQHEFLHHLRDDLRREVREGNDG